MEKTSKNLFDQAMRVNDVKIDGELLNSKKLAQMAQKDLPATVELISKLYSEGKLSSQVMQKMFTGRHFMEISEILTQINGQVDNFVKGIASGVNYSSDFYKSMFDINNQMKQLNINVSNMLQNVFGIGEAMTGFAMTVNQFLEKPLDNSGKNAEQTAISLSKVVKELSSVSLVSLSAIASVGAIKTYIAPIAASLITLNPVSLTVAGIASGLYMVSKYLYNVNKEFADVNIMMDNINLKEADTLKNLNNIRSYLTNIKMTVKSVGEEDIINPQSRETLAILTKDLDTFKNSMDSISNIKSINKDDISLNITKYSSDLSNITEQVINTQNELKNTINKTIDDIVDSQSKVNKNVVKEILETYIKVRKEVTDPKKIEEEIGKVAKKYGRRKDWAKNIIGDFDNSGELKKAYENYESILKESQGLYDKTKGQLDETLKQITKNQEAFNKVQAETASAKAKLFSLTGEFTKNGITYTGLEGFVKLFQSSEIEDSETKIQSLKISLEKLNQERKDLIDQQILEGNNNSEDLKTLDEKIKNTQKQIDIESTHLANKLEYIEKINLEDLNNIQFTKDNKNELYKILSIRSAIAELSKEDTLENIRAIKELKVQEQIYIAIAKLYSDAEIAQKNKTTYQIKYVNYLKENLSIELEYAKIGKTKGEQEALIYSYKLKQLEIDKKIADKEVLVARNTIGNLKIEESLRKQLLSIKTTKEGQDFIDKFYESHKNVLTGELGKQDKNVYEAIKVYTNALSKSENLSDKFNLESIKVIRETIDEIPNVIKNSISSLSELVNQGLTPFNNYEEQILKQSEQTLKEYKEKVWNQYNLGSLELVEAINKNIASIDYIKGLEDNSSEIEKVFGSIKNKIKNDKELSKIYIDLDTDKETTVQEKLAFIMKVLLGEQKDLLEVQNKSLETRKKELSIIEKQVKLLSNTGNLFSSFGDIFKIEEISNIGDIIKGFGNFENEMKDININWEQVLKGNDLKANITEIFEGAFKGINLGNIVGTAVGNITGGGIASQQGGALAGLISGAFGMTGWGALATTVGGSLIGGLFDRGDDKAEAERRTKESNKLYNKNTEALQKLAQNMSNLSGGVDSLNNTLISAVSKIPTIDNINGVTDAMTNMYKTMEKTRKFNDVAYQVTKTKKKKGFLGIGGGSTSWTETIEVSVNEMLRRYGFKGALEDMTSQQIRDFSKWLDNYDLGDSDNFGVLADALEDYAEGLDKFDKNIQNFFRDTTMEAFSGISSLEQESLRQQIEDFYKNLGFQIDEETSKQIDKLAEEMSVMVTIMSDVRGEFLNQWRDTGKSAGSVFLSSMSPYIDAMLGNISQIYYDVYFSGVNENLEKEFKNLSEQLVELKKQGKDLDWSSVTDKLSSSFGNVLNSILATKNETASFNEILMELQKQALESGLSLSEIFDLGLMSGTQKDVMESFKDVLTGSESENALTSIGELLGDKIGETMANKMLDNLLSDRILEFSAQIDKAMSGNLSFDSLAELSNQALSVGLMMSAEADRLSAIKELFNFKSDIEYTTQNENIEYSSGVSQNVTNIYNLSSTVEAGSVIESDNIERLAEGLLDIILEKLKVDKGIELGS